jgi:anti-sigma factor RsiW
MNGKCFEIGTIQAFLDGETTPDVSLRLTDHIATCDTCARLVTAAEEENSVVFATLGRELDTLVPTQRLWTKINDSIEVDRAGRPFWQRAIAFVSVALSNPSFAVAAGLIIVVGIAAIFFMNRTPVSNIGSPEIARTSAPTVTTSNAPAPTAPETRAA